MNFRRGIIFGLVFPTTTASGNGVYKQTTRMANQAVFNGTFSGQPGEDPLEYIEDLEIYGEKSQPINERARKKWIHAIKLVVKKKILSPYASLYFLFYLGGGWSCIEGLYPETREAGQSHLRQARPSSFNCRQETCRCRWRLRRSSPAALEPGHTYLQVAWARASFSYRVPCDLVVYTVRLLLTRLVSFDLGLPPTR